MPDAPEKAGEVITAAIDTDSELYAIRAVLSALLPLKPEARTRVLDYVFKRLGLALDAGSSLLTESAGLSVAGMEPIAPTAPTSSTSVQDIRSLAQQKSPRSAVEMAALVAYYLSDVAPQSLRKDTVTSDDLKTYFKQANFKLPSSARMTLVNAKNSGYLKSVGEGQYKLNPVGYNLVVHNLPSRSENPRKTRKTKKSSRSR